MPRPQRGTGARPLRRGTARMNLTPALLPVQCSDGHRYEVMACMPAQPSPACCGCQRWCGRAPLPAAGTGAAAKGVAVYLHEWRGSGSSSLRPSRARDWGYREVLEQDLPASQAVMAAADEEAGPCPGSSVATAWAGSWPACMPAATPLHFHHLWLAASGSPFWRGFPPPRGWLLPLVYRFLPWIAQRQGVLHGRRLGFGGTEARGRSPTGHASG